MKEKLPSSRFRKQLKDQLPILTEEGLITQEQAVRLGQRYRLEALGSEAMGHLLSVIYLVGSLLIGIGIISFVAAHWEAIPRGVKVAMLFAAMLTAHGAGFWLWKWRGSHPKLGHTLVLLGTLIFGASIGLMAQIFHIRGNPYQAFLAWSVGALVIAYAAGSVPNAVVALVTAGIYYFGMIGDYRNDAPLWFPPVAAMVFTPLLIWLQSRWLLWGLLLLLAAAVPMGAADTLNGSDTIFTLFCLMGFAFIGTAMAGHLREPTAFIAIPARIVAVAATVFGLYFASFNEIADDMFRHNTQHFALLPPAGWITIGFFIAIGLGMAAWALARRPSSADVMLFICIAVAFAVLAVLPFMAPAYALVFSANLVYLVLCGVLFYHSFHGESRGAFWGAAVLLLLLIVSRTLEYETELLLKAVVFVACGVAFIVSGIWFERFLKGRRQQHA